MSPFLSLVLRSGPLGKQQIDTVVSLQRRDGHWYLADHLRHAQAALAPPADEATDAAPDPGVETP